MANEAVSYAVLGVYILIVLGAGMLGALFTFLNRNKPDQVKEHYLAGGGLSSFTWFFTMAASLFSGYSVNGICNEAYNTGWSATRWIPAGVGVYIGFIVLAPRMYSLGKTRGYVTVSDVLFDRYLPPAGRVWVAHALRFVAFFCLQLPIFTYLITQFQSVGTEVRTFTDGAISAKTAVLVSAGVLLLCDIFGGMRAVAYTDVLQGIVLFIGSVVFLIIQSTELGGLAEASGYYKDPANVGNPKVANMYFIPQQQTIVAYFDFVLKTTLAATMYPHLTMRLFVAKSSWGMRKGLACMNFTFFLVQLASMITGWTAISVAKQLPAGKSAFAGVLILVADKGPGQAFASALLLASGICAMMSTADSALLCFHGMWLRDLYKAYIRPKAGQFEQLMFGRVMAVIGLAIGVLLGLLSIEQGKPNLSSLFALQAITPIHIVPAMWLGLHWRKLRGEAVLAGWAVGIAVTFGIVFSDKNIAWAKGSDMTESGLSGALIGFFVNLFVTVTLGLILQFRPQWLGSMAPSRNEDWPTPVMHANSTAHLEPDGPASPTSDADGAKVAEVELTVEGAVAVAAEGAACGAKEAEVPRPPLKARLSAWFDSVYWGTLARMHPRFIDIGPKLDRMLNPWAWAAMALLLMFSVPFYRKPGAPEQWVGAMGSWAFTSLIISGVLAALAAYTYLFLWEDYTPLPCAFDYAALNGDPQADKAKHSSVGGEDGDANGGLGGMDRKESGAEEEAEGAKAAVGGASEAHAAPVHAHPLPPKVHGHQD